MTKEKEARERVAKIYGEGRGRRKESDREGERREGWSGTKGWQGQRGRRGVRTEKLRRKVRAQDDGALAGATDMRPSTSIEGCTAIEFAGFPPPPSVQPTLPATSFVSLARTRRVVVLFRRPVFDPSVPNEQRFRVVTNPSASPHRQRWSTHSGRPRTSSKLFSPSSRYATFFRYR